MVVPEAGVGITVRQVAAPQGKAMQVGMAMQERMPVEAGAVLEV
jgi:hypothetical protein